MHVHDLPPEILLEIFVQATDSSPFETGGSTVAIATSQVCRKWRTVALDYPPLWSDIRLSSGCSLSKLDRLASRYQKRPISIEIDGRSAEDLALIHHWTFFNSLLSRCDRICALNIIAPIHILNLFSRALVQTWPLLHRLHLVNDFPPHSTAEEIARKLPCWNIYNPGLFAPHLKYFSLTAITPARPQYFRSLTELHVRESGYLGRFKASDMTSFHNLQTLSIDCSPLPWIPEDVDPIDTTIVSLTLKNLRPTDNPPGVLTRLLFTLRMPALEHVAIHNLHGYLRDEFVDWLVAQAAHNPCLRSVVSE